MTELALMLDKYTFSTAIKFHGKLQKIRCNSIVRVVGP